jgi:hypothetical protein
MSLVRITAKARREWHERKEAWNQSKAAKLEEQRRSKMARLAGEKAAMGVDVMTTQPTFRQPTNGDAAHTHDATDLDQHKFTVTFFKDEFAKTLTTAKRATGLDPVAPSGA